MLPDWILTEMESLRARQFTGRVWMNMNQGGVALLGIVPRNGDPVELAWKTGRRVQLTK